MIRFFRGAWAPLPAPLRLFCVWIIPLVVACVAAETYCALVLHKTGIYSWPMLPFYDCTDFRCFQARFAHFHQLDVFSNAPDRGLQFGYPAAGAVLYQMFYLMKPHPMICFFVITLAATAALVAALARSMRREGVTPAATAAFLTLAITLSYPLWFEYLLANMEVCIFLLVAAGVIAFLKDRGYVAAVCFALAGSIKILPLVYLGLLLSRKQYRQFALGIVLFPLFNLLSLWLVCPSLGEAWRGIQEGLTNFRDLYVLTCRPEEANFDHSPFSLLKCWVFAGDAHALARALPVYLAVSAVAGVAIYFWRIRRMPPTNQVICLGVASVLLPPLSHDYTLLNLYVGWGLLVLLAARAARERKVVPGIKAAFVAFALLFTPQAELIVRGASLNGAIKAATLIVLMVIALRYPFADASEEKSPAAATS